MGLEAAEGGGEKEEEEDGSDGVKRGWRAGGRERAGEVATSPRKSRVMPTRNCTTPRAPLPTPPRSRLALTPPPGTPSRPFLPVLSPSLRFSHPLPSPAPRDPTDRPTSLVCLLSRLRPSHLTDLTHPQGITPSTAAPAVSAAPPANLGETETIAAPTSTRCD